MFFRKYKEEIEKLKRIITAKDIKIMVKDTEIHDLEERIMKKNFEISKLKEVIYDRNDEILKLKSKSPNAESYKGGFTYKPKHVDFVTVNGVTKIWDCKSVMEGVGFRFTFQEIKETKETKETKEVTGRRAIELMYEGKELISKSSSLKYRYNRVTGFEFKPINYGNWTISNLSYMQLENTNYTIVEDKEQKIITGEDVEFYLRQGKVLKSKTSGALYKYSIIDKRIKFYSEIFKEWSNSFNDFTSLGLDEYTIVGCDKC
jgi:hypothetical protein